MKAVRGEAWIILTVLVMTLAGCLPAKPGSTARETCGDCHGTLKGFSPLHPVRSMGCASCHLGDPRSAKKADSHQGMIAIPGNLATAEQTCGAPGCHAETVDHVSTSLMATARGIVAVNRWAFGESAVASGTDGMAELEDSPADSHLRQLCVSCHLGAEKTETGPLDTRSRGGGCLACHLSYDAKPERNGHAKLTMDVPDTRCFGCHSRSGRISLNIRGWHETVLSADGVVPSDSLDILADGRVVERQPADVHHELGLTCVDCHTSREIMGTGEPYAHQEQATEVTCETCHTADTSGGLPWAALSEVDRKLVSLREEADPPPDRRFAPAGRSGKPVTNLWRNAETGWMLRLKSDGRLLTPTAPASACEYAGHDRLSCQSCHSDWVPQCLGCHTQKIDTGEWVELIADFRAEAPVLGIRTQHDPDGRVEPFAPGMIMTINAHPAPSHSNFADSAGSGRFRRLYAPQVPHTSSREGRDCASCHLDPLALGYGRGTLSLAPEGTWSFEPEYASLRDGLPADAWIAFPGSLSRAGTGNGAGIAEGSEAGAPAASGSRLPRNASTTREDARPFSESEQRRILRVGACLTCHSAERSFEGTIFEQFDSSLERVTDACIVPDV